MGSYYVDFTKTMSIQLKLNLFWAFLKSDIFVLLNSAKVEPFIFTFGQLRIWATAKLSESGETSLLPALPVLATQLKAVQCAMNAQDVANVIWATAKLSEAEDSLLALLPVLAARVEVVRTHGCPF